MLAFFIGMLLFIVLTLITSAWLLFKESKKEKRFELKAVAIIGSLALLYMFIMPAHSAPDETAHYGQSYALSNRLMFKEATDEQGFIYMRKEDTKIVLNERIGRNDYHQQVMNFFSLSSDNEMVVSEHTGVDTFVFAHLPQAVGITIGRLLNLGQLSTVFLGRLCNLLFYLLLLYFALKWMPFAKHVFIIIGMLPIMLEVVSSYSYDASVLGLSFFFTAYVLHLAYIKEKVTWKDAVILIAVISYLAPIKVIYALLAFLCFLIPKKKFGKTRNYIACICGMVICVSLFILLAQVDRFSAYVNETNTQLGYVEGEGYTLSYLITHPKEVVMLVLNTIHIHGGIELLQLLGQQLGWLEIQLNMLIPFSFAGLLMLSTIKKEGEPIYFRTSDKIISIAIIISVAFLALFTMMLAWTPDTSLFVQGVQGRYYIPVLPLLLLLLRNQNITVKKPIYPKLIFSAVLLNAWALINVMEIVLSR